MSNKRILYLALILIWTISGCVVSKPDSNFVSEPDYNKRVTVEDPHFDKVLSPVGYAGIITTTAAGAYAGYESGLIQYYSGGERKTFDAGGAIIGAAVGFTTSYLICRAFGWGTSYKAPDANQWIEKTNNNLKLLAENQKKYTLMHKAAESSYVVKNMTDINDFLTVFPGSVKTNDVLWAGGQTLSRAELPTLITKKTDNPFNKNIKYRYLNLSSTTNECIESKDRYSDLNDSAEFNAIQKIATVEDVKQIEKNWPKTKYNTLLGEKHFKVAKTTEQFIDVAEKHPELDDRCNLEAVKYIQNINNIKAHYTKWGNSYSANLIEEKAIVVCKREELPIFISLYSAEKNTKAKKKYLLESKDFEELIKASIKYPGFLDFPISHNYYNINAVDTNYQYLSGQAVLFGNDKLNIFQSSLLDIFLRTEFTIKKASKEELFKFIEMLKANDWLKARTRENGTLDYIKTAYTEIDNINRIEEFEWIKSNGTIEDKAKFSNKYAGSSEASTFSEELNNYVNKYVHITSSDYWAAKGDASWLNDLAETSRDFIHGGSNYNVFVYGYIENTSNVELNVTLKIDFVRFKTSGISIARSTSEERNSDVNNLIVPPGIKVPFLAIYKNLSEGTMVGNNLLLSAGTSYSLPKNPVQISKSYYFGNISYKQMLDHIHNIDMVMNKGNIDRKLSPTESAEKWVNDKFGLEPDTRSQLRIKNTLTGSTLYISSISQNGKNIPGISGSIDGNEYNDFYLNPGDYVVKTTRGDLPVTIKGRMTHLIVKEDEFVVDYDDMD